MSALTNRYEDDDASHIPPGMKRVGYDTDTERYTFREGDDLWLGEPGSFYGGQMKWAGKVPGAATDRNSRGQGDETTNNGGTDPMKNCESATSPSENRFHEHARKALSQSSRSQRRNEGDWGVPAISISATGAEPPDSPGDHGTLKRRASKFKEAAELTADVFGLNRQWTRRRRTTTNAAEQEK